MEIKRYYTDDKGKVEIDGLILRVRESTKYKNYCYAVKNIRKSKRFVTLGIALFIISFFVLVGSVGHVELMSIKELQDDWKLSTYIIIDSIGTVLMLVGIAVMKFGHSKESIFEKWIDEYLEQNTAKRRR